jgi:hypothetical protein
MTQREQFKRLAGSFKKATEEYFDRTPGEKREEALNLMKKSVQDFTREWKELTNQRCPPGWEECEDGSCMPPGMCPPTAPVGE